MSLNFRSEFLVIVAAFGFFASACGATDAGALEDDGVTKETLAAEGGTDEGAAPEEQAEDDTAEEGGEILGTATQALILMPVHGGNGGAPGGFLQAGALKGAFLRTGDFVDQLTIVGDAGIFGPFGGGGGDSRVINARRDERFVGIYGRSGDFVDQLGFVVSNRSDNLPTNVTQAFGGAGGGFFFDICPGGTRLVGVNVRSGAFLDSIQALCN